MDIIFSISGKVIKNKGRGKKLGFPTANLEAPTDIPDGIFAGYTTIDGKRHKSMLFVGKAETFGDEERFAESHILDFHDDLYGIEIKLEAVKKIREARKFYDPEEMLNQMRMDEKITRVLLDDK